MDVGVCLPYMEEELDRERLLAWCRAIDEGPFSALSCGERITGYTVEMRTTLAAAAAVTSRVKIVPSLYVLPMHSPVWAAKEIATLDLISGGRVEVTVGVGGRQKDYEAVGAPFAQRHQRQDDAVAEMRRIWRGEPPCEGADPVGPRPVQQPGPPILAGVMGPKATARAARWADGVYAWSGNGEKAEIGGMLERCEAAWQEAGRDTGPRRVGGFWFSLADDGQRRLTEYVYHYVLNFGDAVASAMSKLVTRSSADAVREGLDNLAEAGCEEMYLVPATADLAEVERASRVVEQWRG